MIDSKILGTRLIQARESIKPVAPNPRQFAKKAGIDPSQYGKMERGTKGLGPEKIEALCSAWNINIDWLFTGKGTIFGATEEVKDETVQSNPGDVYGQSLILALKQNDKLTDSNAILVDNLRDLVKMLKSKNSIDGDEKRILEDTAGTVLGLREMLTEVVALVQKKPVPQVQAELNKKVKAAMIRVRNRDTVAADGN